MSNILSTDPIFNVLYKIYSIPNNLLFFHANCSLIGVYKKPKIDQLLQRDNSSFAVSYLILKYAAENAKSTLTPQSTNSVVNSADQWANWGAALYAQPSGKPTRNIILTQKNR